MPLSSQISHRALKHTRAIHVPSFPRDDGLGDIDAHINATKIRHAELASGISPEGSPIYDLRLNVIDAEPISDVAPDVAPYPAYCKTISSASRKLVGPNLLHGFHRALRERLSCVQERTSPTEFGQGLPAVAIQVSACEVIDTRDGAGAAGQGEKAFQLRRSRALQTDGAAVAQFYRHSAVRSAAAVESS